MTDTIWTMDFQNLLAILKVAHNVRPNTICIYSEFEDYANAANEDYAEMHPKLANQFKYMHEAIAMMQETPEDSRGIDAKLHNISDGILRYKDGVVTIKGHH